MSVMKINSPESSHAHITKDDISSHFQKLHGKLQRCHYPQLVVNMDESGFVQRPDKNTTKNCICVKRCPVAPSFIDENDSSHITIVAAIKKPLVFINTSIHHLECRQNVI